MKRKKSKILLAFAASSSLLVQFAESQDDEQKGTNTVNEANSAETPLYICTVN